MIYRIEDGEVYIPLDWSLYTSDRRRVSVASEEELREFLKSHPDEDFFLVPIPFFNQVLSQEEKNTLDPHNDIRCGLVHYDPATGTFISQDTLKVTYTEKARQSATAFSLLRQATARLVEVLRSSAALTVAIWDRTEDARGRPLYTLRLSDWGGAVTAAFTIKELQAAVQDRYRWRELWDGLLQDRAKRQLSKLTSASV
jgi:hypothetical protein